MQRSQILNFIQKNLSDYRFNHILEVEKNIIQLAKIYKLNSMECRVSALFHDIAKELEEEKTKKIINDKSIIENYPKNSWHGFASAKILKENYPTLATEDILESIKYHTIGKKHWNKIGYVLYISDFCDPNKLNKKEINLVWNEAKKNLIKACILRTNFTIEKINKKNFKPCKTTLEILEELKNKIDFFI